ncbi:hypothetical protein [Halopseudomonas salegens]|uniref:Uncharacterized protein n=1 Tax=Halopseudomonas salegens TaxID=1434072 RepID=A0A1H2I074_9GAMM|nr:hypothetical protein [Halopseudomonas salegens]SDU37580.1 hypothetical protein SAMN05216210_3456 [Halopseudomonas salegens]
MSTTSNPFEWLGAALGTVIRVIIDSLMWLFDMITGASTAFINGFSQALGVDSGILTFAAVILGLFLIYLGVQRMFRKRFVAGIIWILLGLWLLSALIR